MQMELSLCSNVGNKPAEMRVPAEVYSRVAGYFRPVVQWNPGKREEFRERITCSLDQAPARAGRVL